MEFLHWMEQTGLSTWIREADTAWAYPAVITLHSAGLIGTVGLLDARMLGLFRQFPGAALQRLAPWGVLGFVINLVTGF